MKHSNENSEEGVKESEQAVDILEEELPELDEFDI